MNVFFAKVFQTLDISRNIFVTICRSGLDRIRYIDAFNSFDFQSGCFNCFLQCVDLFLCPEITGLLVVECCDDSGNSGDLTNLFKRHSIVARSIPSECHFHRSLLLFPDGFITDSVITVTLKRNDCDNCCVHCKSCDYHLT